MLLLLPVSQGHEWGWTSGRTLGFGASVLGASSAKPRCWAAGPKRMAPAGLRGPVASAKLTVVRITNDRILENATVSAPRRPPGATPN